MSSRSLAPDTMLSIAIGCVMTRDRYTQDPAPVIAELRATAGERIDLLAAEVGSFLGYYGDQWTRTLTDALREAFTDLDLDPHIRLGRERRGFGHSTAGFRQ